jgi:hypothetical protein
MTPCPVTNNDKSKERGHTDHEGTRVLRWKENMIERTIFWVLTACAVLGFFGRFGVTCYFLFNGDCIWTCCLLNSLEKIYKLYSNILQNSSVINLSDKETIQVKISHTEKDTDRSCERSE